jgi:diaminopropionate ammonia-lyase
MPSSLLLNHRTSAVPAGVRPGPHVHAFHRRLPGYAPTPLRDMPALAAEVGVHRVLVKDESSRMGLPAFKILGASWATYWALCERLGGEPEWATLDDLAAVVAERLGPLRLVAATDGNHGRAVARMARLLGLRSTIVVPDGTAEARIGGITSEGAEVVVAPGTYDDAVTLSAGMAGDRELVISDTSWPGYEDPPRRVIEGYATIFAEIEVQLVEMGLDAPGLEVTETGVEVPGAPVVDVAVVPLGVGALGASAGACLRAGREPGGGPLASPPPSRPGTWWRCPARTVRSWRGSTAASRRSWPCRWSPRPSTPSWRSTTSAAAGPSGRWPTRASTSARPAPPPSPA